MMICYRDMTFCADYRECVTEDCFRQLTEDDSRNATRLDIPIAWMHLKDTCHKWEEK